MNHDEAPSSPLPAHSRDAGRDGAGRRQDGRAAVLIALATVLQAWLILVVGGQGRVPILGDDGPAYHRLALNLLDHGAFSLATSPPFEPTVFRAPGYPFFVAVVYALSGRSFLALRLVQFALLGATAWLLFRLARRFVTRGAAAIAALLCVLLWPMAFLPAFHLTETISTFGCVLWTLLLAQACDADESAPRLAFWLGVVSGLSTLIRPSLSLLVLVPLVAWFLMRGPWQRRMNFAALTCIGFALCVGPWLARNAMVCRHPISITAASGISLDVSARQYAGELSYGLSPQEWRRIIVPEQQRRRNEIKRALNRRSVVPLSVRRELEEDRLYTRDAKAAFGHLSLWQVLSDVPVRAAYFWSNNDDAPWSPANLPVHGVLAASVLLGLWRSRKTLRHHWPLWAVPLYLTAMHLVFHVESRYSFPARPFLFVYIGLALAMAGADGKECFSHRWTQINADG